MEQHKQNNIMLEAYEAYADDIYRHCYFRLYNQELAKDIMQETFCKTWIYMTKGKEIKNIRAFLYQVADNLITDEIRKKREGSLESIVEEGVMPESFVVEDGTERAVSVKEVMVLIEELEESYRTVVIMRFIDELTPREIAEALGMSENAVSVKVHRGVEKLRQLAKDRNLLE